MVVWSSVLATERKHNKKSASFAFGYRGFVLKVLNNFVFGIAKPGSFSEPPVVKSGFSD